MFWRKILAGLLVGLMTSPAWAGADVLGSVTSSKTATVRNMALSPGSTVFSGDAISVGTRGAARLALAGGGQAEVLGNSLVRLTKAGNKTQLIVDRGQASFHVSGGTDLEALVADATVRAADGHDTSAIIQALNEEHAVVAAEKGTLLITTAHDGKTYMVREGAAADLSLASETEQGGGPAPAGQGTTSKRSKKKKALVVILIGGGTAITAYLLARRETTQPTNVLQNEISPTKLN
jgi:hypothetical protein